MQYLINMKKALMVTLSMLLLGAGCKSSKNMSTVEAQSGDGPNLVISMKKTSCYGRCPVYEISIFSDHRVVLKGEKYLDYVGTFTATIPAEEYQQLYDLFAKSSFFDFEDEYMTAVSDLPTTYLYFSTQRRSKKIRDYYGSPQELKDLETMVAKLLDELQWKEETE